MRWANIDCDKGLVTLEWQRTTDKGKVVEKRLKTEDSERQFYLTDRSETVLRREYERQQKKNELLGSDYHDGGYVLCIPNGVTYHPHISKQ